MPWSGCRRLLVSRGPRRPDNQDRLPVPSPNCVRATTSDRRAMGHGSPAGIPGSHGSRGVAPAAGGRTRVVGPEACSCGMAPGARTTTSKPSATRSSSPPPEYQPRTQPGSAGLLPPAHSRSSFVSEPYGPLVAAYGSSQPRGAVQTCEDAGFLSAPLCRRSQETCTRRTSSGVPAPRRADAAPARGEPDADSTG
jgi:hypothetical protein